MSSVTGLDRVLRNLKNIKEGVIQEIVWGAEAVQAKCVQDARQNCPNVSGNLAQSIQEGPVTVDATGVYAVVIANADYASFVEFGAGPAVGHGQFFPPPDALRDWCEKVLGDASLAFVVARAIWKRGLYAHPFMAPALETNISFFVRAVEAGAQRGISKFGI